MESQAANVVESWPTVVHTKTNKHFLCHTPQIKRYFEQHRTDRERKREREGEREGEKVLDDH